MARVISITDNVDFDVTGDETLLEAALRAGLPLTHACGGQAKCSTCRIWILDGVAACAPRSPQEAALAERLGLTDEVRLACQLRPKAELRIRRLVLDETDLALSSQLDRHTATRAGEAKNVTIFFSDITDFTPLSKILSPYDVMYLLNRYFAQAGDIIERNGGYIDKFVGDGVMAIFGLDEPALAPLRAVNAALQTLDAVDRMKPFLADLYGIEFDIRIGIHCGEAVIGSLGSIGHERLTAIGDVVNVASRIEAANKDAGTRLLVSAALFDEVKDDVEAADFIRIRLRGTSDRMTLYEIDRLQAAAAAKLKGGNSDSMRFAGKRWIRVLAEDELAPGERRILNFDNCDIVIVRTSNAFYAFNNACPHLNLPLYESRRFAEGDTRPPHLESTITDDHNLICRWHQSCFDLQSGEIHNWVPSLQDDGTMPGLDFLGDVSKNRARLKVYPWRVREGYLWLAVE